VSRNNIKRDRASVASPVPFEIPTRLFYASIFAPLSADCESSAYNVFGFAEWFRFFFYSFIFCRSALRTLEFFIFIHLEISLREFPHGACTRSALARRDQDGDRAEKRKLTRRFYPNLLFAREASRLSGSFRLPERRASALSGTTQALSRSLRCEVEFKSLPKQIRAVHTMCTANRLLSSSMPTWSDLLPESFRP